MPTLQTITNRALSELGRPNVSNVNDSPDAIYVQQKIIELFPEVMQEATWIFAKVYVENSTPLSSNFSPDYRYSYQLPGDFGQFYKFASTGAQWPSYEFADDMLLAQTNPVQYYYISNNPAFEILPPLFTRALVLYAAAMSATTVTNNETLETKLMKKYEYWLGKAILQNDMQRSVESTPYNDFDRITLI